MTLFWTHSIGPERKSKVSYCSNFIVKVSMTECPNWIFSYLRRPRSSYLMGIDQTIPPGSHDWITAEGARELWNRKALSSHHSHLTASDCFTTPLCTLCSHYEHFHRSARLTLRPRQITLWPSLRRKSIDLGRGNPDNWSFSCGYRRCGGWTFP